MARFPTRRELSPATGEDEQFDNESDDHEDEIAALIPTPPKVAEPAIPVRRYRVTNPTPISILYDGYNALIRPGKVFDEHAYDVDRLRKQGVMLEEMEQ
jgi:hypothetical protein